MRARVSPRRGKPALSSDCSRRTLASRSIAADYWQLAWRGKAELKWSERLRLNVGREVLGRADRRNQCRPRLARLHGRNGRHGPLEALGKPGDEPPGKAGGQIRHFGDAPDGPHRLARNGSGAGDVIGTQCRRHHHNRQNLSSPPHELAYLKTFAKRPEGLMPRYCAPTTGRVKCSRSTAALVHTAIEGRWFTTFGLTPRHACERRCFRRTCHEHFKTPWVPVVILQHNEPASRAFGGSCPSLPAAIPAEKRRPRRHPATRHRPALWTTAGRGTHVVAANRAELALCRTLRLGSCGLLPTPSQEQNDQASLQ